MAVSLFKTFIAGEVLTAADLNSSLSQVFDNGQDLGWPATKAKDLDGNELILDADGDTSITADTDDQVDVKIAGSDVIAFKAAQNDFEKPIFIKEMADAIADVAAYGQLWVNTATPNELWFTDDAGTDFLLSVGQATAAAIFAETNENTYITPDLLNEAPSTAKAWVHFDASSGTPTVDGSYNVSSLTDDGVGLTTINFDTDLSSTAFCAVGTHDAHARGSGPCKFTAYAVGSVQLQTVQESPDNTGAFVDAVDVNAVIFGELV